MAARAVERFFVPANLTALRRLALRFVAGVADQEMVGLMRARAIPGPWPAAERVLVGVRTGPYADQMVRAGYRMANRLQAEWTVLSVETERDLEAAEEDGSGSATPWRRPGRSGAGSWCRAADVAGGIVRYARRNNVTMILLGKPRGAGILLSPVYRVMRETGGIALHLVDPLDRIRSQSSGRLPRPSVSEAGVAILLVAAATGVNLALRDVVSPSNLLIVQLIPVVIAALFLGRAAAVLTATISILLFNLLFVSPSYTLAVSDWEYFISFVGYLVVALVISILAGRLPTCSRRSARARRRSRRWPGSRGTSKGRRPGGRSSSGSRTTCTGTQEGRRSYWSRGAESWSGPRATHRFHSTRRRWRLRPGCTEPGAGRSGARPLPAGKGRYLPLVASGRALGVVGVIPGEKEGGTAGDVLEGIARLGALELDRLG